MKRFKKHKQKVSNTSTINGMAKSKYFPDIFFVLVFSLLFFSGIVVFSYVVCLFVLFYFIIILFCFNFGLFVCWFPFISVMSFLVSLVVLVFFYNSCQWEGRVCVQFLLSYLFLFFVCFYFSFVGSKVILIPQWVRGGIDLLVARV